jgi:ABC-type antimicrobial peptide transport system permease subunit
MARTWEASLRLALGAAPWKIVASMLRQATRQILAGALAGVVAFYFLRNLLSTLLFETSAADPFVIAGSALAVILLAILAAAWQSRRLAAVSPALGLRAAER